MGIKDFWNIAVPDTSVIENVIQKINDEKLNEVDARKLINSLPLTKTIKDLGLPTTMKELTGMTLAIDANLISWQCMSAIKLDKALTDDGGNITQHLLIALNKILLMNKCSINQIWVFDNPSQNPRKLKTNLKRKEQRNKYSSNRVCMKTENYEEIKQLLSMLGITYITAPPGIEGEQYASYLTEGEIIEDRICQYVLTADPDTLLFCGNILRQYSEGTKGNRKNKLATFEYDKLLSDLYMDHDELCQIAMAMGHDFGDKIPRIGVKTVYKKIKSGALEKIYETPEKQEEMHQYNIDITDYIDEVEQHESNYDKDGLIDWLTNKGFNHDSLIKKLSTYVVL